MYDQSTGQYVNMINTERQPRQSHNSNNLSNFFTVTRTSPHGSNGMDDSMNKNGSDGQNQSMGNDDEYFRMNSINGTMSTNTGDTGAGGLSQRK